MKHIRANITFKVIFLILFLVGFVSAKSVGVFPSMVNIALLPVGQELDFHNLTGKYIYIPNDENIPVRYAIRANNEFAEKSKLIGYQSFPDIDWVRIEPETLLVQPGDTGKVNLTFSFPMDSAFYNQRYQLGIVVSRLSEQGPKGAVTIDFPISIESFYLFETFPLRNVIPKGITAVHPDVIKFLSDEAASGDIAEFNLTNNDTLPHTYKLEHYIMHEQDTLRGIKLMIQPFGGYSRITEKNWLKPYLKKFLFFKYGNSITVMANETVSCYIKSNIPSTESDKPYEGIIMVRCDDNDEAKARFIRVLIGGEIGKN